jgi:Sec-independent protein secretion pathway component TatC
MGAHWEVVGMRIFTTVGLVVLVPIIIWQLKKVVQELAPDIKRELKEGGREW